MNDGHAAQPPPTPLDPVEEQRRRLRLKRRQYAQRVAARTAPSAHSAGAEWSISEAQIALDTALTVPEAALAVGRTASSVRSLRQRWRQGRLSPGLASQLPEYRPER
ncbi:hypothetical protein [Mycobacteroides abscessus]|uniref:hypothetical protein n=1 Tax=Mycobacteroides abscessus TaxID=36809 RepID=UPI0009A6A98B|nr:hypothetical protein [Mycobacteroides abscessus]